MTCFSPRRAWRTSRINKNGKSPLTFHGDDKYRVGSSFPLPCGQCVGCRLARSREAATKITLENMLHEKSIFLTLTYADEFLPYIVNPETGEMLSTLKPQDFTLFMKRLRRQIAYHFPDNGNIRFYGCGEYGTENQRPHYHIIIFGFEPSDKKLYKTTFRGDKLYNSDFLEKCWPKGFINFGNVTFESAAYVARYILKKINGDMSEEHYQGRCPEFVRYSNRPGIGANWLEKFKSDVYPNDYVLIRDGIKVKPPRYFDKLYEKWFPEDFVKIKENRIKNFAQSIHEELKLREVKLPIYEEVTKAFMEELESFYYDAEVLPIKEEVQASKLKQLKRRLEGDI